MSLEQAPLEGLDSVDPRQAQWMAHLGSARVRLNPRKLAQSSAARVLAVSLGITAAGFLTSLILNRGLGPTGRGQLAAALVIAGLLPYLASTGFATSVLYYAGPRREGAPRTLATALPIGLAQSALAGAATYALIPVLLGDQGPSVITSAQVALFSLPANLLSLYLVSAFQSNLRFGTFNALRSIVPAGALVAAVVLESTGTLTAYSMVLVYTLLPFLAFGWSAFRAKRDHLLTRLTPDLGMARTLTTYGLKAYVGEVSNSLNVRLDQLVIAIFLPAEQLGLYVAAVSASQLTIMISFSIRTVIQPQLTYEKEPNVRWSIVRRGLKDYALLGLVLSLGMALIVPIAIPFLFGADFREAIVPTEILIWAVYVLGFKTILAGVAQAYGDPWLASSAELIGAAVTIVTLAFLVPTIGVTGAALSSLLAYATQTTLLGYGLRQIHVDGTRP